MGFVTVLCEIMQMMQLKVHNIGKILPLSQLFIPGHRKMFTSTQTHKSNRLLLSLSLNLLASLHNFPKKHLPT